MNRIRTWLHRRRRARELNATPRLVWHLRRDEILVFGCRRSGRHYDGASRYARIHFGAKFGKNEGLYGRSYAIPTLGLPLDEILMAIDRFTDFAREHPDKTFLVIPVGCGLGGWNPWNIAPLFRAASLLPNVRLPIEFWDVLLPE